MELLIAMFASGELLFPHGRAAESSALRILPSLLFLCIKTSYCTVWRYKSLRTSEIKCLETRSKESKAIKEEFYTCIQNDSVCKKSSMRMIFLNIFQWLFQVSCWHFSVVSVWKNTHRFPFFLRTGCKFCTYVWWTPMEEWPKKL